MRKLITLTLAVLMVGLFAAVVFAAVEAGDDSRSTVGTTETSPTTETTETTTTTEQPGDISGPCDEAEHADDPRCAGIEVRPESRAPAGGADISGPCDEAEHANDPRCAGGIAPRVEDDRGRGGDDLDDHSGPGRGDHDFDDDDHSGSGHGREDDDHRGNSGPGGGD